MNRSCCVVVGLAGLGMAAAMAADPDAAAPEADLLEFLGSWEGEEDDWRAFVDSLPPPGDRSSGEREPGDEDFADWSDADEAK